MDAQVKELVVKELVNLKAQIVLQTVQLDALKTGKFDGQMAQTVAQQQQQISANVDFNKMYAAKLETVLASTDAKPQ